ncbi:MAG: hypothetical protein HS104_05040 [Polyangiaceae bacterium]|nr:hypothetical protein [Polyangiaceae bacterium]
MVEASHRHAHLVGQGEHPHHVVGAVAVDLEEDLAFEHAGQRLGAEITLRRQRLVAELRRFQLLLRPLALPSLALTLLLPLLLAFAPLLALRALLVLGGEFGAFLVELVLALLLGDPPGPPGLPQAPGGEERLALPCQVAHAGRGSLFALAVHTLGFSPQAILSPDGAPAKRIAAAVVARRSLSVTARPPIRLAEPGRTWIVVTPPATARSMAGSCAQKASSARTDAATGAVASLPSSWARAWGCG